MKFKQDAELFRGITGKGKAPDAEPDFAKQYTEALHSAVAEGIRSDKKKTLEYKIYRGESREEKFEWAKDVSARGAMSRIFRPLNAWLEGEYLKGQPYVGRFPETAVKAFYTETDHDLTVYELDYFKELDRNRTWLENYMEEMELFSLRIDGLREEIRVRDQYAKCLKILAVVTLLFFAMLPFKGLWTAHPLFGLFFVPLPFVAVLGVLYCLLQWRRYASACSKSNQQKAFDEFIREAERVLPRMHGILRFYRLWAKEKGKPVPSKVGQIQAVLEENARRYDAVKEGRMP